MSAVMGLFVRVTAVLEVLSHFIQIEAVVLSEVQGALDGEDVALLALVGLVPPPIPLAFEVADLLLELAVPLAQVMESFLQVTGEGLAALDALVLDLARQDAQLGLVVAPLAIEGQAGALEGVCSGLRGSLTPVLVRLPTQPQEVPSLALWELHSGLGGHDVGMEPLDGR